MPRARRGIAGPVTRAVQSPSGRDYWIARMPAGDDMTVERRSKQHQANRRLLRPAQGPRAEAAPGRAVGHAAAAARARSVRAAPADLRALFHGVDEVRLESGFGGGEHLIAEAERHPRTGFIGIEPFVNGMAKALAAIEERKLENIRLHHGDATDMLAWLPAASLVRFDLLYPDPWPKRRHWKRRFVQDKSVAAIARDRAAGRRIPLRQRHSRLRRVDAGAAAALAGFHLDRGAGRRLAAAVAGLFRHALRGQGQAREAACRAI